MAQVFISYSHVDTAFVERFIKRLQQAFPQLTIWYDQAAHGLIGGDAWWEAITNAIEASDVFIYILSNESVNSLYCQAEFTEARRLQKRIITVQARDRTELTDELDDIQFINMKNGVDDAEALMRLNAAVHHQLKQARKLRPLWKPATPKPKKEVPPTRSADAPDVDTPALVKTPLELEALRLQRESDQRQTRLTLLGIGVTVIVTLLAALIGLVPFLTERAENAAGTQAVQDTQAAETRIAQGGTATAQFNTTAVAQAIISQTALAQPSSTPEPSATPTETPAPSATETATPSATATETPSPTETVRPLNPTEVEGTVRAQMAAIQVEEAQTQAAISMATAQRSTEIALSWTPTETPDTRATAEARLTETQIAGITRTWVASWTATPTPTKTYTPTATATLSPEQLALTPVTRNVDWTPVEREFSGITFVLVPAGCFMMGDDGDGGQQCFDEPFWISRTEVTQADFERLGGTKAEANAFPGDDNPVENITWFEAQAFAEANGFRLPTEAEWEYAARGPEGLAYPWGNEWDEDNAVWSGNSGGRTAPVGSKPAGASWVGALDMSGNVWEWTLSEYRDYPYVADDGRNMTQDNSAKRVLRGGSWYFYVTDDFRCDGRYGFNPRGWNHFGGFRLSLSY